MPQTRRPEDIQRDIAGERERIEAALAGLGNDVDDLISEIRRDALELAHRALIVAPFAGAVVGALTVAAFRRRRRKRMAAADE